MFGAVKDEVNSSVHCIKENLVGYTDHSELS
jgi:hypothetical protein